MWRRLRILMVGLIFGAGLPACFPGGDERALVSLELSLSELGLAGQQPAVYNWMDWLENGGVDVLGAFDLGAPANNFFMALDLRGKAANGSLGYYGTSLSIQGDLLVAELDISECIDCFFNAVIFWEEEIQTASMVSTFTGQSPIFSARPGQWLNPIDMDVYLEPTGSVRCKSAPTSYQGEVWLAAMDAEEKVIFPAVYGLSVGRGVELVLPHIPVGRPMHVLIKRLMDDPYAPNPVAMDVTVATAGQEVVVEFSL